MQLLADLLAANPSSPRFTSYDEATGARLDFSAQTLDTWAAKIANMLREELELEAGDTIAIALPANWQAVVIALGAYAAGVQVQLCSPHAAADAAEEVDAIFVTPTHQDLDTAAIVLAVTDDPFGRGVEECGGELAPGVLDFSPLTRTYGDVFFEDGPTLAEVATQAGVPEVPAEQRVLNTGWQDDASFQAAVVGPLATGGSVVTVIGLAHADSPRLDAIAATEKVTQRI